MRVTKKIREEQLAILEETYRGAKPELIFHNPFELLIAVILSAQCTDARVNLVSRELFRAYPTPAAMAAAPLADIEALVKPCGLYHTKAENIRDASAILVSEYGGELPGTMEELLRLPGVGRKIANLLLGDVFGQPAVVTDTHCIRICGRLGMYPETERDPYRVEKVLTGLIDPAGSADFCHRIVQFGRDWCTARAPKCATCPLAGAGLCEKQLRESRGAGQPAGGAKAAKKEKTKAGRPAGRTGAAKKTRAGKTSAGGAHTDMKETAGGGAHHGG